MRLEDLQATAPSPLRYYRLLECLFGAGLISLRRIALSCYCGWETYIKKIEALKGLWHTAACFWSRDSAPNLNDTLINRWNSKRSRRRCRQQEILAPISPKCSGTVYGFGFHEFVRFGAVSSVEASRRRWMARVFPASSTAALDVSSQASLSALINRTARTVVVKLFFFRAQLALNEAGDSVCGFWIRLPYLQAAVYGAFWSDLASLTSLVLVTALYVISLDVLLGPAICSCRVYSHPTVCLV